MVQASQEKRTLQATYLNASSPSGAIAELLTGAWAAVVAAGDASLRCSFALASISASCARALFALHTQGRGFIRLHAMGK